jgi:hypothetical protein
MRGGRDRTGSRSPDVQAPAAAETIGAGTHPKGADMLTRNDRR